MIVDRAVYRGGRRLSDADAATARQDGDLLWIGLHEPTPEEFGAVTAEFELHDLLVEDALKAHQRPKVERYGDVAFVVAKTAAYDAPDDVVIGELQLIVGPGFVLSLRHGDGSPLAAVRRRLEGDAALLAHGGAAVLYAAIDAVVDDYALVIEELEVDVDEAEAAVFSDDRDNPAARIFGLKRQVLELLRNVVPMGELLRDLMVAQVVVVDDELRLGFRDVDDHLQRVLSRLELVRDVLSDALDANLAQVGVRQNDDMRTISAWAAIIAAPTLLAGVWGMNFSHMPELSWSVGYPIAVGSMAVVAGVLWWRFRRVGWI
ncbi:MAG: magnesium and cobalt transport protein CorA [Acidimicrobiales bacterium]|nr:magnesium and cobalt transport protein CorA [Acidimicrobiales bacterium]HRW36592.1 magnesium and cobalt transport protein CorA [Aquihabitans sp.]